MRTLIETAKTLYEQDEHAWAAEQIAHLDSGELEKLDRKNLAQYLLEMTRRDQRELQSRMETLLVHMLKIVAQPNKHTRSWTKTIWTQQKGIKALLRTVPTLDAKASEFWALAFKEALTQSCRETKLPLTAFPSTNPWTIEEALAYDPPSPSSPMDVWKRKNR